MAAPTRGSATSTTELVVNWVALSSPQNGDSTIYTYNLEWDAGTAGVTFTSIHGFAPYSLVTTYTRSTDVVAGQSYQFRVRALNIHGWGSYSPVLTIVASSKPGQMATVTTSIDSATGKLKIQWVAPNDNFNTITAYKIEILKKSDSLFAQDLTNCDGSSATVRANLYCLIPMSTLTAAPYGYAFDELVVVKASATNAFGFGLTSAINTSGGKIRQVPDQMNTPVVVSLSTTSI